MRAPKYALTMPDLMIFATGICRDLMRGAKHSSQKERS